MLLHTIYVPVSQHSIIKGKVHSHTGHEGPDGEQRYSSTLSITSALYGGGWSMPHPGRFTPKKKTQYPLYRSLGGAQGQPGRVWKIPPPVEYDPQDHTAHSESLYQLHDPGPHTLHSRRIRLNVSDKNNYPLSCLITRIQTWGKW